MPKGIHDSSSDSSLILGHEMQITVHAPPGYDGSRYYDAAKGLMINTVERASFGGLPFYQQRQKLADDTIIVAVLNHGVQRVDVFPASQEEGPSTKAIFVFRPKAGYPKAVIILDEDKTDGIELKWADNILAGNFHCQDQQQNNMLLSIHIDDNNSYMEGRVASSNANPRVYCSGFLLVNTPNDAIGAALVDNKMFCVVLNTGTSMTFYSHPLIGIDYGNDPADPLLDFSSFELVHTIPFKSYVTMNKVTTTCTFNLTGEKARVAALGGVSSVTGGNACAQDVWDITLSVSNGIMSVSETHDVTHHHYYWDRVVTANQQLPEVNTTKYFGEISYNENLYPGFDDYWREMTDYYYENQKVRFASMIDAGGASIEPMYSKDSHLHRFGLIQYLSTVGPDDRVGIEGGGSTTVPGEQESFLDLKYNNQPGGGRTVSGNDGTVWPYGSAGVLAHGLQSRYDIDQKDIITFDFLFTEEPIEEEKSKVANPWVQDWCRTGQSPMYDVQWTVEARDNSPDPTTYHFKGVYDPPYPIAARFETLSGSSEEINEDVDVGEFNMRPGVAIIGRKKAPSKKVDLTWEDPRSTTPWYDNAADQAWPDPDPDYSVNGDCYIQFVTANGEDDLPGLTAKHGNVNDQKDCVYRAPFALENASNSDNSPKYPIYPPYYCPDSNLAPMMLSREKDYTLYSVTDYYVIKNERFYSSLNPVKIVLNMYNHITRQHIDILARYNDLLVNDERTEHLDPLVDTDTGNPDHYLYESGVLGNIPIPKLII